MEQHIFHTVSRPVFQQISIYIKVTRIFHRRVFTPYTGCHTRLYQALVQAAIGLVGQYVAQNVKSSIVFICAGHYVVAH